MVGHSTYRLEPLLLLKWTKQHVKHLEDVSDPDRCGYVTSKLRHEGFHEAYLACPATSRQVEEPLRSSSLKPPFSSLIRSSIYQNRTPYSFLRFRREMLADSRIRGPVGLTFKAVPDPRRKFVSFCPSFGIILSLSL